MVTFFVFGFIPVYFNWIIIQWDESPPPNVMGRKLWIALRIP